MRYGMGREVRVITESIQRSNGAAWKGDVGVIVNVTGDGYQVRFGNVVLDTVKDSDVTAA